LAGLLPTVEEWQEQVPGGNQVETGLRREWRIINAGPNVGNLRGVCWRQRGKDRKAVKYVGKRFNKSEFAKYDSEYEKWRRTHRTLASVGLVADRNPVEAR